MTIDEEWELYLASKPTDDRKLTPILVVLLILLALTLLGNASEYY